MTELDQLCEAVAAGNRVKTTSLTQHLLDAGMSAQTLIEDGLVRGMAGVGEKFKCGEIFVPEMLMAARAMKESLKLLQPLLVSAGIKPRYTAVIGTVQGDMHDIGKNLVALMWRGAAFEVVDLGVNVSPAVFVNAVQRHAPQIVGLSALLTTTMAAMKATVDELKIAEIPGMHIMVGGAPVTQEYCVEIGADGYAANASAAVDVAKLLVGATVVPAAVSAN